MNKVLVKAQPSELIFSPSQLWLCLRENRSAPSLPLAGEQLVPSFFLWFVWKSKGTVFGEEAGHVCINHSHLWGNRL